MSNEIQSMTDAANNAELFEQAAQLGYINGRTLDLSYGHGKFWSRLQPDELVTNDVNPNKGDHHHDVRHGCPLEWFQQFDCVVWDGPYRLSGTRDLDDFDERYGLETPIPWQDSIRLLQIGTWTALDACRRRGLALVKCQDQTSSGGKRWQTDAITRMAELYGATKIDQLHLPTTGRPQRSQRTSRANYSTLLVFKAPRT